MEFTFNLSVGSQGQRRTLTSDVEWKFDSAFTPPIYSAFNQAPVTVYRALAGVSYALTDPVR